MQYRLPAGIRPDAGLCVGYLGCEDPLTAFALAKSSESWLCRTEVNTTHSSCIEPVSGATLYKTRRITARADMSRLVAPLCKLLATHMHDLGIAHRIPANMVMAWGSVVKLAGAIVFGGRQSGKTNQLLHKLQLISHE